MFAVRIAVVLWSLLVLVHPVVVSAIDLPLPARLASLSSKAGIGYFSEAGIKQPYWQLSRFFTTQKDLTYCGVASSVMVLNALGKLPGSSPSYYPYHLFNQDNIFYNHTILSQVATPAHVQRKGMTLAQLAGMLSASGAKTVLYYGSEVDTVKRLQQLLIDAAAQGKYVIINYDRRALQQQGGGHISPIAAYHQGADRWLVMDVARFRYPPVWVKTTDLLKSIQGVDTDSGKSRGFVVVS